MDAGDCTLVVSYIPGGYRKHLFLPSTAIDDIEKYTDPGKNVLETQLREAYEKILQI